MNKCIIFLSKEENYLKSAQKIKEGLKLQSDINYIEDFILEENKNERLENWIVNPFLYNFYKDTFLYSTGVK